MSQTVRTQTRIPAELADWLREKARQESRSMNGQLVDILKRAKEREALCRP